MIVNEYDPIKSFSPLTQQRGLDKPDETEGKTFKDTVAGFISEVNDQHIEAGQQSERFIKGEPVDIHDVMITAAKAKTSFQLLMELRNKGLDLYREVMRMQV